MDGIVFYSTYDNSNNNTVLSAVKVSRSMADGWPRPGVTTTNNHRHPPLMIARVMFAEKFQRLQYHL